MTTTLSPESEASKANFLYRQLFITPPAVSSSSVDLAGQTGIVTGANAGLGFQSSRQLLGLGLSRLILACRSESKANEAKQQLLREYPKAQVDVWILDLSSYDSVTQFAKRCESLQSLQFAILNAGVLKPNLVVNKTTGKEEHLQVNYLSTALLTILLLPILSSKSNGAGRLTIVSSETASWAEFKQQHHDPIFPAFNDTKAFDSQERYATTKLLEQLFLVQLVQRVPSVGTSGVVVNTVNPGWCYGSSLADESATGLVGRIFLIVRRLVGRSSEVGGRTLTDAAVMHGNETHGKYLGDCIIKPMAPFVYSEQGKKIGERLWKETMAELAFAGAEGIVESFSRDIGSK